MAFQSSDVTFLGDYYPDSNLENPGALNVPPGHLTKAPLPIGPLSASQVASVEVMTEPCSFAKFPDTVRPGSPYRVCSEAITESSKRHTQPDGRAGKQA